MIDWNFCNQIDMTESELNQLCPTVLLRPAL